MAAADSSSCKRPLRSVKAYSADPTRKQYGGEVIELHAFDDQRAQSDALAKAVGDALHASLAAQATATATGAGQATLAVSGGSSPRPFLQMLSTQPFDWSRIAVTLVDDRWVPETDSASNSRLAHETLLQNAAQAAAFWPLVDTTPDARSARCRAERRPRCASCRTSRCWAWARTAIRRRSSRIRRSGTSPSRTPERFVAVHPGSAPHARVSWSMSALKASGPSVSVDCRTAQDGRAERRRRCATKKCHLTVGKRQGSETRCLLV